jgi:hypothetical protein
MAISFIVITAYFILSIAFQIKHFVADYPLQNEYMLGKFKGGLDWIKPLAAHCAVHGAMTFFILLLLCHWLSFPMILFLTVLDMGIHFVMDRIKASPNLLGVFKPLTKETYPTASEDEKRHNKYFWWSLGLDQGIHHLTHELIVYIAVLMLVLAL